MDFEKLKNAAAKAASTVAETAEKSSAVLKSAENFTSKLNDVAKNAFAEKGEVEEIPNAPQDAENAHVGEVSDANLSEKSAQGPLNTAAVHVIKAVSVVIPAAKGLLKFAEKTSKTLTLIKFFLIAILVLLALILVGVVVSIVK